MGQCGWVPAADCPALTVLLCGGEQSREASCLVSHKSADPIHEGPHPILITHQ